MEEIVEIGALETKSPRGSNEPVTMTSSITGAPVLEDVVDASSAKVELIETKGARKIIKGRQRCVMMQCSKNKFRNR